MLYLTRKIGESIRIGDDIEVHVAEIKGKAAKIGLRFPVGVSVLRGEVFERVRAENQAAAAGGDLMASFFRKH